MFEIIPAIDILSGQCVRLKQGRYDDKIVYDPEPLKVAAKWASQGASRLHVVDLDGARTGTPKNLELIKQIARELAIPIQVGGGLRRFDLIKEMLASGVDRIVLGTTAVNNPNLLEQICAAFGPRLAVALDVKNGQVATEGWVKISKKDVLTLAQEAVALGVKRFIYTDISRDGMLTGPNFESIKEFIAQVDVPVIASGGVAAPEDIAKLKETGAEGCIVGKALYEGKVTLAEVV